MKMDEFVQCTINNWDKNMCTISKEEFSNMFPNSWDESNQFDLGSDPNQFESWSIIRLDPKKVDCKWAERVSKFVGNDIEPTDKDLQKIVPDKTKKSSKRRKFNRTIRKINELRGQKFYEPIVSDGDEIIDGNHRLSVAKGEERKYVYIIEPLKSAVNRIA